MKRFSLSVILPCRERPEALLSTVSVRRSGVLPWACSLAALFGCASALANDGVGESWELNVSPYAIHFNQTSEHKHVYALSVQRNEANGDLVGGSVFSNSFGQPSAYAFIGRKYAQPLGWKDIYVQWTAGVLYGYKGKYKDKVPLNANGFSPGFIPAVGYELTPTQSVQLTFLGNSALMFNWAWKFR